MNVPGTASVLGALNPTTLNTTFEMNRKFLPISIDITDQKILVLGGDESALKKIQILQRFDAKIEVLSRKFIPEILQLDLPTHQKNYTPSDLEGYLMVYSCLNNDELDRQVVNDAKQAGVLVNIHDKPALCQFISPAVYQHEKMTVAVASNGENVFSSIKLRNYLQQHLNDNIQNIIDL